jgi:hypothetical protein
MTDAFIRNGSIVSAKIGTLSADKITSGFISATRIQANTIDASKIRLDNSTITSGTVNGVPNTVIIKSLGVDTLQLADQAVTIPSSATTAGNITTGFPGMTTVQTVTWTSSGAPTTAACSCVCQSGGAGASSFVLRVYLDGVLIKGQAAQTSPLHTAAAFIFTFTPTAGSRTLVFKTMGQFAADKTNSRSMLIIETKK